MQTEQLDLGGIPALVWGPPSDGAVVAVHGNLSHKADTPIQLLAEAASARALQVLSFDLPGHGGRKDEPAPCRIQVCVPELKAVMGYAKKRWAHVGLFACSLLQPGSLRGRAAGTGAVPFPCLGYAAAH